MYWLCSYSFLVIQIDILVQYLVQVILLLYWESVICVGFIFFCLSSCLFAVVIFSCKILVNFRLEFCMYFLMFNFVCRCQIELITSCVCRLSTSFVPDMLIKGITNILFLIIHLFICCIGIFACAIMNLDYYQYYYYLSYLISYIIQWISYNFYIPVI